MHRSESHELLSCAGCSAPVDSREGMYSFGVEVVLCLACAVQRGGAYDAEHDRWTTSPDVSDLAEPVR